VSSSLSMRVRVMFLTSGIRAVLSYNLNISYSSSSHASLGPQPVARTPAISAHPSSPAQTSISSSEAASSPRSSPTLVCHVRRTVSALGHLERAAPAGGRGCRSRGTRASDGRDCSDGGKGDDGTDSSKGRSRSSSGGREMQFSLSKKRIAKEAWDAIAAARIDSDRTRKTTLQALRKEWKNLALKTGEDVDDFALRLNTLQQKMVQFGDDTYDEERAVEKLFRCIPEKYKQIARSSLCWTSPRCRSKR
jgi:hypothetical protein